MDKHQNQQEYINALEDALLFAREENQLHQWNETGIIILTNPSFPEKRCKICGAINWGGKEDGVCFGNISAEQGIIAAHNRRVATITSTSLNDTSKNVQAGGLGRTWTSE